MGIADSPLSGRVLFVEGAPRSGTTGLAALLGTHPQIAGSGTEAHLFDMGVNTLFDNHEARAWGTYLSGFLTGEELTDLARDLCDGILLRVRERAKPGATWVAEKTPVFSDSAWQVTQRKLRCYPDAWYVHIVRDEQAAARSIMTSPFDAPRSRRAAARGVREAVEAIRVTLSGNARYLELKQEDLRAEPVAGVRKVLDWIGAETDRSVLEQIGSLSSEHFSRHEPVKVRRPGMRPLHVLAQEGRRVARPLRRRLREAAVETRPPSPGLQAADRLVEAARAGDETRVRDATTPGFTIEVRTGAGDVKASGDDARRVLLEFGERVLRRFYVSVEWSGADGSPFVTHLFHAVDPDAARVDLSLHHFPRGDRVGRLTIIAAGELDGRPLATWSAPGSTGAGAPS